tara:strand:- start:134 stop:628 length:495 start_codon:yes stop_codon:yes gene_type:complete
MRVHHSRKCFRFTKYDLFGKNTTHFGTKSAFIIALATAIPDENTQLSSAPSSFARTDSTSNALGLSAREYTYSCGESPFALCVSLLCASYAASLENVVDGCTDGTSAPVLGDWYRDAEEQSNAACSKSISFAKRSTVSTKSFELPNSKEFEKEKGKEKGKENIM